MLAKYLKRIHSAVNDAVEAVGSAGDTIKIFISLFQIVGSLSNTLHVTFPPSITTMFSTFHKVNFLSLNYGSPQCAVTYRLDYIDNMMTQTLAPLALIVAILVALAIHSRFLRYKNAGADKVTADEQMEKIVAHYFTLILLLTYLVLPSVTTTIFGSFLCIDVDPDGILPLEQRRYLLSDMSISCSSARYVFGMTWAVVMVFVYPIGVLSFYFFLLYKNRVAIMTRTGGGRNGEDAVSVRDDDCSAAANEHGGGPGGLQGGSRMLTNNKFPITHNEIKFLYTAYEGRVWYW